MEQAATRARAPDRGGFEDEREVCGSLPPSDRTRTSWLAPHGAACERLFAERGRLGHPSYHCLLRGDGRHARLPVRSHFPGGLSFGILASRLGVSCRGELVCAVRQG